MVQYLKKKALYELAKEISNEELPACKVFTYRHYHGAEWLECFEFKISSLFYGNWIKIEQRKYDENSDDYFITEDVYSEKRDGHYYYHSRNGKLLAIN